MFFKRVQRLAYRLKTGVLANKLQRKGQKPIGSPAGSRLCVDFVYENANEGTDYAYLTGLANFGVYKNGNDMWIAANNDDIMVLADWYLSNDVEYVYNQGTQELFTTAYLAQFAQDLTPQTAAATLFMSNANMQDVPSFINTELQLNPDVIALAGVHAPILTELA